MSLGWGFVALATIAVMAWTFARRRGPSVVYVPVLATVALFALLCSLSPERVIGDVTFTRPSAWIYPVLPMFRSYARFGVVVQLMTVMLAAIGAHHLWSGRTTWSRSTCVVLLALGAFEYVVWPPALSRDVLPTAAHRWVMQQPRAMRVLDCAALTPESQSIHWLTRDRVSMRNEAFDECTGPSVAGRLAAAGYTHMLVRRSSPEASWFRTRGLPPDVTSAWRGRDAEVFAPVGRPAVVETVAMHGFYPREYSTSRSWRWMNQEASWVVTNRGETTVVTTLDIDLGASAHPRSLHVLLDGLVVHTVTVAPSHAVHRLGPFVLSPGRHDIRFRSVEPAAPADLHGDRRRLSIAFGAWTWVTEATP